MASVDEYGRALEYVEGRTPNNPQLRKRMFGPTVTPRPQYDPTAVPAFTNDQPQE